MVIHEDFEAPIEVPVIKKPALLIPNKYVMMKNHIREVAASDESEKHVSEISNHTEHSVEKKRNKELCESQMSSQESVLCFNEESSSEITKSDLEELATVYRKCKRILKKIESKYGHLLNLDDGETSHTSAGNESDTEKRKRKLKINQCNDNTEIETPCTCHMKKKIVFDDYGEQVQLSPRKANHICLKKLKNYRENYIKIGGKCEKMKDHSTEDLKIEQEESDSLPDDIVSLSKLLQNDDMGISYRKKIIDKMKMLTKEHNFELQLSKQTLIRQLKECPEDVIEFKGSNLFSLPGYLDS
ncbi:hypothetical protein EVAR_80776_1 [Eumeta japonica]|uniref:Uncharacterized protein n=1 Tax=Eumeta variegata TaxID=151549 RepID=A0A4C1XAT2_EUMVA|nr:hypothetical protein EVAR_80776_1 [Eumeta japonica]